MFQLHLLKAVTISSRKVFFCDTLRKLTFTEYYSTVIVAVVGGYEQLRKMACTTFSFQRDFGNLGAFLASS